MAELHNHFETRLREFDEKLQKASAGGSKATAPSISSLARDFSELQVSYMGESLQIKNPDGVHHTWSGQA